MSNSKQNQDNSSVDMGQFGPAMAQMPPSEKKIEAPYPLDDPKMSEQLTFYKAATGIQDPEKLKEHILAIRNEGCKTFPFPCILCFYFLQGMIINHPFYQNVRNEIEKKTATRKLFIDIGAGMGTDLRQTIYYGWNRKDVIGVEIEHEWKTLGYKLFRDSDRPIAYFMGNVLESKVLDATSSAKVDVTKVDLHSLKNLNPLKGTAKFVTLNQLFHFFDEEGQRQLAERCALLLSDEVGSTIFGMQIGGVKKGLESHKMFVHSPQTWQELWESVFAPRKVKVVSELVEVGPEAHLISLFPGCKSMQRLYWSVTRV
ncbi:hypothetical protein PCASD_21006 [Puccinia coronata f. sp. avenae]|uniref:Methyltransferase domain-containing protein n=1 Tax=Puccinia coronata f. sp. avenae TaxID=200324 RepID=A0A2N5TMK9_9BASI|nr:hypothetical protein PCASD_20156 [Puccinia coronata f. sp. avenae]PLW27595.1 hypothetical protein PCASD_21006 [Puccinia coronata f. sp. avenae]